MKTALFLARRMKLGADGSRRSRMAIVVPVIGVTLSIVIMLLTIAIISGFKNEITRKITGFDSQISISETTDAIVNEPVIERDSRLIDIIRQNVPGADVSLSLYQPAMLKTNDDFSALIFRSYDDPAKWDFVRENIVEGQFPFDSPDTDEAENSIILSTTMASQMQLKVGDKINTCFFIDGKIRLRNYKVAALYNTNFGDYDRSIGYASPTSIRSLRGLRDNEASLIELSGLAPDRIDVNAANLRRALTSAYNLGEIEKIYSVSAITETGAIYFNWLSLLDTNVVVIIILMSAISIFTLISSLFILILERVSMIGSLKAIGAGDGLIRRTFILLASRIFIRGLVFGNIIGIGLIFIQRATHLVRLNPDSYYVSYVPAEISLWQILLLNAVALIVCFAVMIIPSHIISRMKPARIIHFE